MDISSLKIEISSSKIGYFREILRKLKKIDFFKRNSFFASNFEFFQLFGYQNEEKQLIYQFLTFLSIRFKKIENI